MERLLVIPDQKLTVNNYYNLLLISSIVSDLEITSICCKDKAMDVSIVRFNSRLPGSIDHVRTQIDIPSGLSVIDGDGNGIDRDSILERKCLVPIDPGLETKLGILMSAGSDVYQEVVLDLLKGNANVRVADAIDRAYNELVARRAFSVLPSKAEVYVKRPTYLDELRFVGAPVYDIYSIEEERYLLLDGWLMMLASDLDSLGLEHKINGELFRRAVQDLDYELVRYAPELTSNEIPEVHNCTFEVEMKVWKHGHVTLMSPVRMVHIDSGLEFTAVEIRKGIEKKISNLSSFVIIIASGKEIQANLVLYIMSLLFEHISLRRLIGKDGSTDVISYGNIMYKKEINVDIFNYL